MRLHARLLLGLCGLALAQVVATAAPPADDEAAASAPPPPQQQQSADHHHKGFFHRRHCVECQRAYVKAHDGIDVPAPPPLGAGEAPGPAASHAIPGHMVDVQTGECLTCQGRVVMPGPAAGGDPNAPGYAVVGDTMQGPEPAPIGMARGHQPSWAGARPAGAQPGAGPYDPSVAQAGLPPAQVALAGPGSNRPHIISHLLGIPKFGYFRRRDEDKERQKHAAITYDQSASQVNELPASLVYGKDGK
jgi:hypothetical protein